MADNFVCRIVQRDRDSSHGACERGCGVIAKILWDELLTQPSCFEKKYNRSVFESRKFYVLLTAHCNLYGESEYEEPLGKYINSGDFSLVFHSIEIPLRECIAPVDARRNDDRCIAVTCCGIDSILVLCEYEIVKLGYTLKSHRGAGNECRNFVVLFLEAEAVNHYLGSDCNPPILRKTAAVHDVCMLWRTAERMVKKVDLHLEDTSALESNSASDRESLHCQMENSRKQQSFNLTEVPSEVDQPCCIGAPVIMTSPDGGSAIVGINAGGRITTLHGIFAFLKGGLGHFLAVMSQARTLMPSRWKYHVIAFVPTLHNLSSVLDLFHQLLHRETSGVRILKFNMEGGAPLSEIVSGLQVYTAIFKHYGSLVKQGQTDAVRCKPCGGALCHCLKQIRSDMRETLNHFSSLENPPEDIAVALFECFEAMQSFNYDNMAEEILSENRKYLDELSTKECIDSNKSVNKSFKWIDILARCRESQPRQESSQVALVSEK
jgi:hypothetical protein